MSLRVKNGRVFAYAAASVLSVYFLYPLYVLFLEAFTPVKYTARIYPYQYPPEITFANLVTALTAPGFIQPFIRSLEVAFLVGLIAMVIGIPAAYGLSRLPTRIAYGITTLLFIVNMMPAIVIAIPIASQFISLGLYSTVLGLALAQELVVLPLAIFILLGAFQAIPRDLEYQARIDGAGLLRAVFGLIVPLAKIGATVAFLLSWMFSWDEFTFAVILSPNNPTLPIVIYQDMTRGNILAASAFALLVTIPVLILTALLQRYLKGEYLSGGLKG
jgi:trehalose transport system permease protein